MSDDTGLCEYSKDLSEVPLFNSNSVNEKQDETNDCKWDASDLSRFGTDSPEDIVKCVKVGIFENKYKKNQFFLIIYNIILILEICYKIL